MKFFLVLLLVTSPAFAELDLNGFWATLQHQDWQDRNPGPEAVDYSGLPINDEARTRALSYTASMLSLPERQCLFYPPQYTEIGPQSLKLWSETDPQSGRVVAWKISAAPDRSIRTIWMDGRPHPSANAPHPFSGFSTGVWNGDTLVVTTTHVKAGYVRRNGVPSSDQAKVTEFFMRRDETLTITALIEDPIYLTEPMVISRVWKFDPALQFAPNADACVPAAEVARLDGTGTVPHILPGENPFLDELTTLYGIPRDATLGGAKTMYPEYRKEIKAVFKEPQKCTRYCCGWQGNAAVRTLKDCIGDQRLIPGTITMPGATRTQ
jgi:hypothetical protein